MKKFLILILIVLILISGYLFLVNYKKKLSLKNVDYINQPTSGANNQVESSGTSVNLPKNRADCEKAGGGWISWGGTVNGECNRPAKDGDKICSDNSACDSQVCLADKNDENKIGKQTKGKCAKWMINLGCYSRILNGKVAPILCQD